MLLASSATAITDIIPMVVTNGIISKNSVNSVNIASPTSRIDFPSSDGESIDITTVYWGSTEETSALASGIVVHQYGVKLRSANTCNVVYIMHNFSNAPTVSISVKQNDGMSTHKECGAGGYKQIATISVPKTIVGQQIRMKAYFLEDTLHYMENNTLLWSGKVSFNKKCISGFRSDNVKVNLILWN